MPAKPKAQTTRRSARADVRKGTASKPKAAVKATRVRRAPSQLLEDLKAQRDDLAKRMDAKLAKLDAKIAKVEARYEKSIQLAELQSVGTDELAKQLEEAKRQQKLLRMALKAKK